MTTFISRAGLLACALFLAACMGSSNEQGSAASMAISPNETRPNVFEASNFAPLPAADTPSAELQATRERILGPNAMDPEQVKFWWVGVSSFIASMKGHLFLMDAWEIVGVHADYVPIGREELAAIQPEAIFIGHGHFDHAADAGYVAGLSNALLVAGSNVCDIARERAASEGIPNTFPCLNLGDHSTPGVGSVQSIKIWEDLPEVNVVQHTHSAAEPADLLSGGMPLVYIPNVLTFPTYLNTSLAEALRFVGTLRDDGGVGQPAGGTWAYHFRAGDFAWFWHDSTGVMKVGNAESEAIANALTKLPECVDVQLNAIVGFGLLTSAYRDALAYVALTQPKVALPTHHDAWTPGIGGGAAAYESTWLNAVAKLPKPPEVDYLRDPVDYMKARSYNINDARWAGGC
ncbi:MBL fold metallo-hydrolase [Limnobacter parvus]|uniref:MBL fold metallo-hydrolase n=1 Tax=Limnobacter parvus TaxID=2939690 RepID=A0ABT1XHS9_9BURK|nr:MBL fold metallo-hydrolase [Limnobacter parvus]MCR2746148.1 MBL fold metallo-hydrolase [Limnobacter parvus]